MDFYAQSAIVSKINNPLHKTVKGPLNLHMESCNCCIFTLGADIVPNSMIPMHNFTVSEHRALRLDSLLNFLDNPNPEGE